MQVAMNLHKAKAGSGNSSLFGSLLSAIVPGYFSVGRSSATGTILSCSVIPGLPIAGGEVINMSRVCQVTGKRPMTGNNVSHAKNRTRRRFLPNLHTHRFWVESEKRFVKLRVSAKGMRIIDKRGIDAVIAEINASGGKV